jgi:hypothetical protein
MVLSTGERRRCDAARDAWDIPTGRWQATSYLAEETILLEANQIGTSQTPVASNLQGRRSRVFHLYLGSVDSIYPVNAYINVLSIFLILGPFPITQRND